MAQEVAVAAQGQGESAVGREPRAPLIDRLRRFEGLPPGLDLDGALAKVEPGETLPDALGRLGLVDRETRLAFIASDRGVPQLSGIDQDTMDPAVLTLVSKMLAKSLVVFPLFRVGKDLTIAMVDPTDIWVRTDLERQTGLSILPVACEKDEIVHAIERFYSSQAALDDVLIEMVDSYSDGIEVLTQEEIVETEMTGKEAPIIKLVNLIISEAINARASDIHIEPEEAKLRVRYRVDGYLKETIEPAKRFQASIISRIKIMANMDIAEKRKPQDGRIKIKVFNRMIDLRVSSLPGVHGEKIVMRVLDPSMLNVRLDDLGFSGPNLERYQKIIAKPYGILLVTGPTGSGKSTTLYATLARLNTPEKNIITIEDPVEYLLAGINQIQVNVKAGMTFSGALRSVLRQDPDVVMIGEMRDQETAETAIRASLTGHFVFSTLHTNDAPGAVTRLLDMGVAPYLVSSSVVGAVAQRLCRVICQNCKTAYSPTEDERRFLGPAAASITTLFRGEGCSQCDHMGYRGRIAVMEVLVADEEIRQLVVERQAAGAIRAAAAKGGMISIWDDGVAKAKAGMTTVEELQNSVTIEE